MINRFFSLQTLLILFVVMAVTGPENSPLSFTSAAVAQSETTDDTDVEEEEEEPLRPLVMVNCASLEHMLQNVDYVFALAERPEYSELINGALANVNDLQGFNRTKPFGLMIYVEPGLLPIPIPVGYVPVDNVELFMETVEMGPFATLKVEDEENRYEIAGPRGILQVKIVDGYAFIASDALHLDWEFEAPEEVTETVSSRYDLSLSVNVNVVGETTRNVFLTYLQSSAAGELQQGNDEPDGAYRVRKAEAEFLLEFIEQLLTHGEKLILGIQASPTTRQAILELSLDAQDDSSLSEFLIGIGGRHSYFSNAIDDKAPLTFSTSWGLDDSMKEMVMEIMSVAESEIVADMKDDEGDPTPIGKIFESLRETAEAGQVDLFSQFFIYPGGQFVLIGGMKLASGHKFGNAVADLMNRLDSDPNVAELDVNMGSHGGVTFHRVRGTKSRRQDERLYGGKPALYLGGSSKAIWYAVGGDNALTSLKLAIDQVSQAQIEVTRPPDAPLQFVVNMSTWLSKMGDGQFAELAKASFKEYPDALRLEARPTEKGGRFRLEFDEGFLRLLGLAISGRIDERFGL